MKPIVTYRGAVYPWQCDHIGHMNVMWYIGKFDEASWNLLACIGITPSYIRDAQTGMAGVEQNVTYKRELLAGKRVNTITLLYGAKDREHNEAVVLRALLEGDMS